MTERKRKAILDAAVAEFKTRGFDKTSMDQIAKTANVSKRTVYNHFPDKNSLFQSIIDEMVGRADVLPDFPYDSRRSIERQLADFSLQIIKVLSDSEFQSLAKVVVSRLLTAPEFSRYLDQRTKALDAKLIEWLKEAVRDKKLAIKDFDAAAEQLMGLLLSYAFWPRLLGIKKSIHKKSSAAFVKETVAMFLKSYRS